MDFYRNLSYTKFNLLPKDKDKKILVSPKEQYVFVQPIVIIIPFSENLKHIIFGQARPMKCFIANPACFECTLEKLL